MKRSKKQVRTQTKHTTHTSDTSSKEKVSDASELEFWAPKLISQSHAWCPVWSEWVCLIWTTTVERWKMLTDQANHRWWRIQMTIYIEGDGESPITSAFFGGFKKNSSMACFGASQHTFRVPQRSPKVLGKNRQRMLEVTDSVCSSARMLPDLEKSRNLWTQQC